jgi:hypothetical protein
MCDWDEAEYAEYLLWLEAAEASTRAPGAASPRKFRPMDVEPTAPLPAAMEA